MEHIADYLTPAEAAEVLKCTTALLAKYRCARAGPPFVRVGRLVRYGRSDLIEWVEKTRVMPAPIGTNSQKELTGISG